MSLLAGSHVKWAHRHFDMPSGTWKPNLAPNSPEYQPKPPSKGRDREQKRLAGRAFDRTAWGALGEVVMMAEGRHGISLGRVTRNKRKA